MAMALLVAMAPLAQVLCLALASMKQAVPAARQGCPQQLVHSLAGPAAHRGFLPRANALGQAWPKQPVSSH